jgi:ribose transport system substrate-binding protein
MKKTISILLASVLCLALSVSCGPSSSARGSNAVDASDEEYVFVTVLMNLEYFQQHKKAVEDAAAELGAKGYMSGSNEYDANEMIKAFETIIQNPKTKGIITPGHFEDVYRDLFEKAWNAGIPVATVTLGVPNSRALCNFGTDYVNYGYTMAKALGDKIGNRGKVLISQNLTGGGEPAWQIVEGIRKYASEHPAMNVLEPLQDDSDAAVAARVVGAALQANPDTVGVIGCQSVSGVGAATAIREAGLTGKVTVVCIDKDTPTLEAIRDNEIYATVVGKQYTDVYYATKFLYDYNHGNLEFIRNTDYRGLGISPLPSFVDTGSFIITKNNVDAFM